MSFLRTACDFKRKKKWGKKSEKEESWGEKVKSDNQDCCVIFKPKNYLKILLSVHARILQANILHLDQRPRSVRPVNSFVLSFSSLQHDSDQKTTRLDSKCKISKGEWVNQLNSLAD